MSQNNKVPVNLMTQNGSFAASSKASRAIVNIYIPDKKLDSCTDGYLVGYHFENSHYVITSIIAASSVDSLDKLTSLLRQARKLHAFNKYCVSDLSILGIIEDTNLSKSSLLQRVDVSKHKQQSGKLWLQLKKMRFGAG